MKDSNAILISLLIICSCGRRENSNSELTKKYDSLSVEINKVNSLLDSITTNSDSIYQSTFSSKQIPNMNFNFDEFLIRVGKFNQNFKSQLTSDSFPSILPIELNNVDAVIGYGEKIHPMLKTNHFHKGIDFPAERGEFVKATVTGLVKHVEFSFSGYGKHIILKSELGFEILFAHLDSILVRKGEHIKKGEVIGAIGSSGKSTNPHLHYEIRFNNSEIDPILLVAKLFTEEELRLVYGAKNQTLDF